MGYRSLLLTRWSRRDWLAILVVAVTVAFLTGTTLLLIAAGDQTAQVASNRDSPGSATYYGDIETARAAVGADRTLLPVAAVTNGSTRTLLVGVPDKLDAEPGSLNSQLRGASGNTTTLGTIGTARTERLQGSAGAVTVTVRPRGRGASLLAPSWYVTDTGTVDRIGVSGAFVIQSGASTTDRTGVGSVPLRSALQFFTTGMSEILRTFAAVAAGAAVLVGVTVFSVSRMGVRDRLSTIQVVRSTGAAPRTVLGLFTARAVLLTLVGVGLGYALGIILTNATVNLAVTLGVPASLSLEAGPRAIRFLGAVYVGVVCIGGLAGGVAAWPAAHRPPGFLSDDEPTNQRLEVLPELLTPSLLHWRAIVPTTATLSTFVVFVVLVAAIATVAGPIATAGGATITQPGTPHPIASKVPEAYADALHSRGIDASAEILLFEVVAGEPVLARGADFDAFASVTEARLVDGRKPEEPSEALVGVDLVRARGLDIGDEVTLGGSTEVGLTRVRIVGTFAAPGPFDDQVLVSLSTARHLAGRASDEVHLVRADRLPSRADGREPATTGTGIGVVGLSVDAPVAANSSFNATVTLRNEGLQPARESIPVTFDGQERDATVELARGQQQRVRVGFEAGPPGTYVLTAGNATANVSVVDPDSLMLAGVPSRALPGSRPLIRVTNGTGAPVAGANVTVGNRTVTTDTNGRVRVPLTGTGDVEITARSGTESTVQDLSVTPDAIRTLSTTLQVRPSAPSLTTRPEARLVLANPWAEPVNVTVGLEGPGGSLERAVSVRPGRRTTVSTRLAQRPPGSYEVRASVDGRTVEEIEYRVTGDRRIVSALATTGGGGTTGFSQGLEVLFGNFQILVGTLLGLAAFMTVGGTTATFAQAVYARRRTIGVHRATGAPPRRVLRLVLADAARIGLVASVAAFGLALLALQVLDAVGYLTVFGVSLRPVPSPAVSIGIIVGSVCVTLLGATITTLALLRVSPASLLSGAGESFEPAGSDEVGADD
ncbi:MAG: FtsX-like permease family protein [Haloarculaceae archaeon]